MPLATVPRRMGSFGPWAPSWVESLAVPVWVSAPDRTLRYVNPLAERLLECPVSGLLGGPCHEVIQARSPDAQGEPQPFCAARCPFLACVEEGRTIRVQELRIRAASGIDHLLLVIALPIEAPDEANPSLVHLACVMDRAERVIRYVQRVAARTPGHVHPRPESVLTPRELEILRLLCRDLVPPTIAQRLEISPTTVRNHIQHLIAKLGAHSVEEAVALFLTRKRT